MIVANGIVVRLSWIKPDLPFHRKQTAEQLAQQQQDHPEVKDEDPGFVPAEVKSRQMRRDQVEEKQAAN